MQQRFDDSDAAFAAKLAELGAAFGEDVIARWARLVEDVRAATSGSRDVPPQGAEALLRTCEGCVHFFAEILARHGQGQRIARATFNALAQHARQPRPVTVRIVPDPSRN